jgi:hypothetical protein
MLYTLSIEERRHKMTAVLRFEKRSFADKITKNGTIKGVDSGGLYALKKHNEREEINPNYEVKSKRTDHIDPTKSSANIYYKRMTSEEIKRIQKAEHRANAVGAFEFVFDFQDLSNLERENFDAEAHKKLIEEFFEASGITQKFDLLSFVFHLDEKNPHFHAIFSGQDKTQNGKFLVNDHFNKLRADGSRENGTQLLQNSWSEHLEANANRYKNKKDFISALGFSNGIYRRFDKETKERIDLIREAEKLFIRAKQEDNKVKADGLGGFIASEVAKVLKIAQEIQEEQAQERKEQKNKKKEIKNVLRR